MEHTRQTSTGLTDLVMMVSTRVMSGAGLALLLSDRATPEERRSVGWVLLVAGTILSIPLALELFRTGYSRTENVAEISPKIAA